MGASVTLTSGGANGNPAGQEIGISGRPVYTTSNDQFGGANAAVVSIPSATGATTLRSANAGRLGLTIANDSTAILYVLFGNGTPSATNYTLMIPAKGTTPTDRNISGFTGLVQGAWATANGFAMVTEVS